MTSAPNGELTAPFYPLPSDIRILKITKRGAELDLDPTWEGFTTCEGKIEDINSDRKSAYTHIMKRGDFGSIAYNDLRVLIRIGTDLRDNERAQTWSAEYRPSFLEFWWGDKADLPGLYFGLAATVFLIGGFIFGLLNRPDDRPSSFIDLRNEYTLPFIHPDHLSQGPEAQQQSYDRVNVIPSAVRFAKDVTRTVLGFDDHRPPSLSPILETAYESYQVFYANRNHEIADFKEKRQTAEAKILADSRNSLVAIPVIIGEPFSDQLLRVEQLIKLWYQGTRMTVELRREMTPLFKSEKVYDFKEYKNVRNQSTTKISGIQLGFDEKMLYDEAGKLAKSAAAYQNQIKKYREPIELLEAKNNANIGIETNNRFSSVLKPISFHGINSKIAFLNASIFDPSRPKLIREPMIGSIDKLLVEKTITKSQFELQLCYELALRRNQQAGGSMIWRWHLDTRGQIFDVKLVETTIHDPKMIDCIREKLSQWRWPKPQKGSIRLTFPFGFNSSKG